METNYRGIHNLDRDLPGQVEYNRKKNLQQDSQIENLSSQLQTLIERAPAGFLPRVYYGLTRGNQTYRFLTNALISETITGEIGTAYQLYSDNESDNSYIAAVAVKYDEETLKIIIKGDYTVDSSSFTAVNMTTGESTSLTLSGVLSLQNASSLSDYPAQDNKEKQITVLNNLENNSKNVVFASLDYSGDGIYNWVEIGNFVDGVDGKSVRSVNSSNYSTVIATVKVNDSLLAAEAFTADGTTFAIGDLYLVAALSPLTLTLVGNIRGAQGETGATGQDGTDGTKVISDSGAPSNDLGVDGDTYIDTSTWNVYTKESGSWTSVGNIKGANGADGTDGQNGQSFQMQSGLYSTPDNWGESGNVDGEGNALLQLPTLPQSSISGKGYVVYDPLTTPLSPFYDLYYANNGDLTWTIIHPFSGIAGQDGTDGQTPYISSGTWWIGSTNTGVSATGPQGAPGQGIPSGGTTGQVLKKASSTDYDTEWGDAKKYYAHHLRFTMTISGATCVGNFTLYNSSSSAFTKGTLADYLYTNGFTNVNAKNLSLINLTIYNANGNTYKYISNNNLYATNSTTLRVQCSLVTISFADNDLVVSTTNETVYDSSISLNDIVVEI